MSNRVTEETAMGRTRRDGRSGRGLLRGLLPAGVVAALLTGAVPAPASAADYCVAPNTTCGGTPVTSFEQALGLAAAAPDADRIFLGAATYTAPTASGYVYDAPSAPVEIIGAGEGQTVVTDKPGGGSGGSVLRLTGGAGSSVHDVAIELPQNAPGGFTGLSTANTAQRVDVAEDPVQANPRIGVTLEAGGRLVDSAVTIGSTQDTAGVLFDAPGTGLSGSTVAARLAVASHGGAIERSHLTGLTAALDATDDVTTITTSLLRVTAGGAAGIAVIGQLGTTATVHADSITIVGPGLPGTFGAAADDTVFPSQSTAVTLTNSVIRGMSTPLSATAPGTGQATVTASYSDYDPTANTTTGANASIVQANDSNVGDARFVDASAGDFHLRPDSPLIDTGTPPSISGFRADPAVFAVTRAVTARARPAHRGTHFRFALSEGSRVTITIQRILRGRRQGGRCVWPPRRLRHAPPCTLYRALGTLGAVGTDGANSVAFAGRIRGRGLAVGTYLASIHAIDTVDNRSNAPIARFRVIAS